MTAAYLRQGGREPRPADFATTWSPSLKVAARHLSAYLGQSSHGDDAELRSQALDFGEADAKWGDLRSALQWFTMAERLGADLTGPLADRRDAWKRQLAEAPGSE